MMKRVLFICIHNSARSQMAEAYLNKFGGDQFFAESAGLEAGTLNPLAVQVMKEDGIEISENGTKAVDVFFNEGRQYDYVITVCDEANAARCPIFPGVHRKVNWSFNDPSSFTGTTEQKLAQTRQVRNQIREAIIDLIESVK
jgi:arsenate reductase